MAHLFDSKNARPHDEAVSAYDNNKKDSDELADGSVQDELTYEFSDSRKLGITSSVFVILNKMIGTGIFSTPSGIFAVTGSVGVALFLWVIGGVLTFCGLSAFLEFGLAVLCPYSSFIQRADTFRSLEVVERRITSNAFIVIPSY